MTRFTRGCVAALLLGLAWGAAAWGSAEEKEILKATIVKSDNWVMSFEVFDDTMESVEKAINDWFSGEPTTGKCYGLKVGAVAKGKKEEEKLFMRVYLRFVEQPCKEK